MLNIRFEYKDNEYVFDSKYTNYYLDYDKVTTANIDSKFIRETFDSENYIIEKDNIILYDKNLGNYNKNYLKHNRLNQ